MKTIANAQKIKELREQQGWSQNELSEMSTLSLRTIQRMEKYGNNAIESIKSVASVFDLDFKEILQEDNSKKYDHKDFLSRIEIGKQIVTLIGNIEGYDFDLDLSITNQKQLDLIYSFFQDIQNYNDIWDNIEFDGHSEIISHFQDTINQLTKENLWIFGGETKREYGKGKIPLTLNILVLRVYPKESSTISKS